MLKRKLDLNQPLKVVHYLRMSSDTQNPRSPEQQRDTIESTMKRLGKPWTVVGSYTDSGISGRLVRRRPQFQQMIHDIRAGAVTVDAILVDTFERFGRAEELESLRRRLYLKHGVLVLTADRGFADPTDIAGQMMAKFESARATDDNRIKAHCVLRGKRDAAKLKHWPGGVPPFGYRLKSVMVERDGRQEVDYCTLEPDPECDWIIRMVFRTAAERAWGPTRIAKMLNADPTILEKFKPFYTSTIGFWLSQEIYTGVLVWERVATDIVQDARVVEKNDPSDHVRVPDFCVPLVDPALWARVQQYRSLRAARLAAARTANSGGESDKCIAPLIPGLSLNYLLSGLVRCGCDRAMIASSSGVYLAKDGGERRYVSYVCPAYLSGACQNGTRIPEEWLRKIIVDLVARRLLPPV